MKNLLAGYTLSTVIARMMLYTVIARLGTSRGNLSHSVMLSEAKHLLADYALSTVIARLGTSRGNLSHSVILNAVKNLLAGYTLSTVIPRLMLYSVIARLGTSRGNLSHSVMLSEAKHLLKADHRLRKQPQQRAPDHPHPHIIANLLRGNSFAKHRHIYALIPHNIPPH